MLARDIQVYCNKLIYKHNNKFEQKNASEDSCNIVKQLAKRTQKLILVLQGDLMTSENQCHCKVSYCVSMRRVSMRVCVHVDTVSVSMCKCNT